MNVIFEGPFSNVDPLLELEEACKVYVVASTSTGLDLTVNCDDYRTTCRIVTGTLTREIKVARRCRIYAQGQGSVTVEVTTG